MTGTFFLSSVAGGGFFSYRVVRAATVLVVPEEQVMVGYRELEIEDTGELVADGEVVLLD